MPRIRTIKPEFWGDEKLAPCSVTTRLVFLGLISMADDAGRVVDNPKVIDAFIFPETSETCRGSVDDLVAMGRLRRGRTASGQRILEIANWTAHQKIEKPNLRGSLPPIALEVVESQDVTEIPRLVVDASGGNRGSAGEASQNHTNDQRPTTVDQRPTTDDDDQRIGASAGGSIAFDDPHHHAAYLAVLRTAKSPLSVDATILATEQGMHGKAYPLPVIGQALVEILASNGTFSASGLRAFCRKLAEVAAAPTTESGQPIEGFAALAAQLKAEGR